MAQQQQVMDSGPPLKGEKEIEGDKYPEIADQSMFPFLSNSARI